MNNKRRCNVRPYEGPEKYIFVSYCHKDQAYVFPLIEQLAKDGYRVWYDEGIDPGSEWPEIIASHLYNAAICVAIISKNSLNSHNCRREITFALLKKKYFISVFLEPVELTLGVEMQLSAYQSVFKYKYENENEFFKKFYEPEAFAACKGKINPHIVVSSPEDYTDLVPDERIRDPFSDKWFTGETRNSSGGATTEADAATKHFQEELAREEANALKAAEEARHREEEERLRKEKEEAERLRKEEEEAEEHRQEEEEAERRRKEAAEAEKRRLAAEEVERLRKEAEEAEKCRLEAEEKNKKRQEEIALLIAEQEKIRKEAEALTERLRKELEMEAAEQERLREKAEEAERLHKEAEEAERRRKEAEEAEKRRAEAEDAERRRREAEEAEKLRLEAEEAERRRKEAEEAEKLRLEAEEAERRRKEAEEAEKLRLEAEEAERRRKEAEEEPQDSDPIGEDGPTIYEPAYEKRIKSDFQLVRMSTGEVIDILLGVFVIGRSAVRADYVITDDRTVGRVHAIIVSSANGCKITDNKSLNKTLVNGKELEPNDPYSLKDGDMIQISKERFMFRKTMR